MARYNRYTADGQPSWDGIHPKLKSFCGYQFGYHKETHQCAGLNCNKWTHYSLHKRYKFSVNLEKANGEYDWRHKTDRLYICSDQCFSNLILSQMCTIDIPPDVAMNIILNT